MSNETPNSEISPTKGGEIPLEDIDRILSEEDPEFAKSLEEVRQVEDDATVVIDSSVPDETLGAEEKVEAATKLGLKRRWTQAQLWMFQKRVRFQAWVVAATIHSLLWLRVRPKEILLYTFKMLSMVIKKAKAPIQAFRNADLRQKFSVLLLLVMAITSSWILIHNFKGIWLPQFNEPILRDFKSSADSVTKFDPAQEGESFYAAFPQERHEYLFGKMKVNLKRTPEHPLPMGAFELIVLLDSKDTAIEVRDREIEFNDQLQRVFEDETFSDLESELGKTRLKSRLKRELNQKLTQGWVKDVNFKTFILKP